MGTRGVWSLDNVEIKYPQNDWVPLPSVWASKTVTKSDIGWIAGGSHPKLAKIDFSSDSKTQYGYSWQWPQPNSFYAYGVFASGTAGALHGYMAGGSYSNGWPSVRMTSYMTKLVYASATPLVSPTNRLSGNRAYMTAASADTAGYLLGGSTHPSFMPYDSTSDTKLSIVEKITNTTDTSARIPAADLPSAQTKKAMCASAVNPSFAYMSGGIAPIVSTAARFTYSTETVTQTPSANNLIARSYHTSSSNGSTNFYWHGGGLLDKTVANPVSYPSAMTKSTEKTVVSTDTTSSIPAEGDTIYCARATTGNTLAAYTFGGGTPYGITYQSDKMTYSTETKAATPSLNLQGLANQSDISPVKGLTATCPTGETVRFVDEQSETPNFGIFSGQPGGGSWVDKLDYSTETMENIGNISPSSYSPGIKQSCGGSSKTHGYLFASSDFKSIIWKTSYSSDETSMNPARHAVSGDGHGVPMDTSTATYVTNLKDASPAVRACWKITHADDSTSQVPALTKSWNSEEVFGSMSTSSIDEGTAYIAAGGSAIPATYRRTYTEKITFATDTRVRLPATNFPNNSIYGCSVGGPSAGYFSQGYSGGGNNYSSELFKLNYSDETYSYLGNLEGTGGTPYGSRQERKGNLGSTLSGYFFSGMIASTYQGSNVDKFVYASDTISNLPGVLITANPGHPEQWARDIGYGSASARQNNRSIVERPEATPTASTSPQPGTAPNFGIAGGGDVIPGGVYSLFDKLEYSTETNSVLPSSNATTGTPSYTQRSITSLTEAWSNSAAGTHLWKFVYSTSTQNPSPASHTTRNFADGLTFSNKTEGYFGSGANVTAPGPSYSGGSAQALDKFTFSTSTAAAVPDLAASPSGVNYDFNTSNVGNQLAGYYSGGNSRSMGKYVYATSTPSMTNDKLSPTNSIGPMGAGNATNGYFIAGDRSSTDRIAYSTDTLTKLPGASYPSGDQTWGGGSHSSSDAGYIQGGRSPSAPNSPFNYHWSNTRKLTYSTETLSELPAPANISQGRNDYSGFSARQNNNGDAALAPNVI